jgi:recombination protein RecA
MSAKVAMLRSAIERALAGRRAAPFTYRNREIVPTVSAGIAEIDALAGGLPRGSLTEICGPACSGRSSLLVAALAARTAQAEACALVDARDAFDPHSAAAGGVALENLLWVRCRDLNQSLRAADLLLQSGGFGLIAMDLSDLTPETVRRVPLNAWFRFRRAVEDTPTIFLLLEQESNAKTCASLVLRLEGDAARWGFHSSTQTPRWESALGPTERGPATIGRPVTTGRLLEGFAVRAELLRSRVQSAQAGNEPALGCATANLLYFPAVQQKREIFQTQFCSAGGP